MKDLTPAQIVKELDQYIVGQKDAKQAVAIAIRNRWRRQQLDKQLQKDVVPKNIIMIGSTGVGKTEIARRIANLVGAPFIKVEASKYTEVGYHGRDVESMIRDLVECSFKLSRANMMEKVSKQATENVDELLLDKLIPPPPGLHALGGVTSLDNEDDGASELQRYQRTRETMRKKLVAGKLEDQEIEIEFDDSSGGPMIDMFSNQGFEQMGMDLSGMLSNIMPSKTKSRKVKVKAARQALAQMEADRLVDKEELREQAITAAEQSGIVFVDEIDKIALSNESKGADVSRGGVQRDLLPIIEGSTVNTRHGMVNTDHILFIAAGAFHSSKPSDLIPELQGRFPIRVELQDLTEADMVRILEEPKNSISKQYVALLSTENVTLKFKPAGIKELARIATEVNSRVQNVGARRLSTVVEKMLEEVSFHAPDIAPTTISITKEYVLEKLQDILEDEDLSQYVL